MEPQSPDSELLGKDDEESKPDGSLSSPDNSKALRMMALMGYKSGVGLGKNQQGIISPVDVKPQLGKRGLGLVIENLENTSEGWDFSQEEIIVEEKVTWLQNDDDDFQFTYQDMKNWTKEDKPNHNMDNEHNFCNDEILQDVIKGKSIFDELDIKELGQARAKANPFETIRSVFFMNRAALKMANIDAATDFMFTNIDRHPDHKSITGPYYFADVCAGPGGFSEYILWRKKWAFKGFGLTLKDEHDFKLGDSVCASPVTFLPLYGAKGDGDACCPENIRDFKHKVLHESENRGVHFMMSDGGFSVEGNENIQEILSKSLYICQCLLALEVLRIHGYFVTKVFDVFTSFSVGVLFLMYKCFEKVSIFKPNSSRPANSERYFICYKLKGTSYVHHIRNYLRNLVKRLWELRSINDLDVIEIVPMNIIVNDSKFFNYIRNSNNKIAKNQIVHLKKLAAFCRNPQLVDKRQENLRKECLKYWHISDKPKVPLPKLTVDELLSAVLDKKEILLVQPREINNTEGLKNIISDLKDWHYVPMQCTRSTNICNFYAGVGFSKVCRLQCNKWVKVKNAYLTRGTLLYGELLKEKVVIRNADGSNSESEKYSLHVIDALRLGDVSLADLKFHERMKLIATYCKAVNHEFRTGAIRVRPKEIKPLESLSDGGGIFKGDQQLGNYAMALPVLGFKSKEEFFNVNSLLLLKTNENQHFHSSYVLRIQVFINELDDNQGVCLKLSSLVDFINSKLE